jgi:hypothetical protein
MEEVYYRKFHILTSAKKLSSKHYNLTTFSLFYLHFRDIMNLMDLCNAQWSKFLKNSLIYGILDNFCKIGKEFPADSLLVKR